MGVSSLFRYSCSLLVHLRSGGSKAADRTPLGDYYSKVSRKCKNVELWLNVVVLAYFGILFFSLDVYSNIICLFQYLVLCVSMAILQALCMTVSQELLSGNSFTLLNALVLLLLMYKLISILSML